METLTGAPARDFTFKLVDVETPVQGQITFIAAAFGNVDRQRQVIEAGAFDDSIARLQTDGDPIPLIWNHQRDNPEAYVGQIDPTSIVANDADVRMTAQFDMDEPFARKVHDLVVSKRVKEFSFVAAIEDRAFRDDGVVVLKKLNLYEAGPTLIGANPRTGLIAAKDALDAATESLDTDARARLVAAADAVKSAVDQFLEAAERGDETDDARRAVTLEEKSDDTGAVSLSGAAADDELLTFKAQLAAATSRI